MNQSKTNSFTFSTSSASILNGNNTAMAILAASNADSPLTIYGNQGLTGHQTPQLNAPTLNSFSVLTPMENVTAASNPYQRQSSVNQITKDLLSFSSNAGSTITRGRNNASNYLSEIEETILRSNEPISVNENEEIEVNGQRGIWANKQEVINWRGVIPITEYVINQDSNPEIITKRTKQQLEYIQELAIRYLRPPTPPAPGEIIITQEPNKVTPPAPPLIIRQQPARPDTPEPLVVREAPPAPPPQVGRKVITISGKRIPPPPRKVIVERLAQLPSKPQSVLIERWLPYAEVKRRVIFNKPTQPDPVVVKPRNIIVQWEAPQVNVKKEYKYLGVIRANPVEYVQRFGPGLLHSDKLPQLVHEIKTPEGIVLAANYKQNSLHELYGDVQALKLINLDAEGLGEYKQYLQNIGIDSRLSGLQYSNDTFIEQPINSTAQFNSQSIGQSFNQSVSNSTFFGNLNNSQNTNTVIEQIFKSIDRKQTGKITVDDAQKVVLRLNSRLGRRYGEDDVKSFFNTLDSNNDGSIDFNEFKKAFLTIAS